MVGDIVGIAMDQERINFEGMLVSQLLHNREQEVAQFGTRTAINLAGLSRDAEPRGATITLPELAQTTTTLDVCLERSPRLPAEATPLRNNTRVRVHHGTGHGRQDWF